MVSNEQEPLETQNPTDDLNVEVNTEKPEETAEAPTEAAEPENPLAVIEAKLSEANDKYLRLYAEFENFRRRTNKEKLELRQYASEDLMKKLLDVVDDFERAAVAIEKTQTLEAATEGFTIVKNKFFKLLEVQGLKAMNCTGEVFDADLHESITSIPAPSDDMKGKIIDEIQKGFFLNDKPIRFAKVVIGA
jgi:molecular chaperone GrpE